MLLQVRCRWPLSSKSTDRRFPAERCLRIGVKLTQVVCVRLTLHQGSLNSMTGNCTLELSLTFTQALL